MRNGTPWGRADTDPALQQHQVPGASLDGGQHTQAGYSAGLCMPMRQAPSVPLGQVGLWHVAPISRCGRPCRLTLVQGGSCGTTQASAWGVGLKCVPVALSAATGPRDQGMLVLGGSHLTKCPRRYLWVQELSQPLTGPAQGCLSFPPIHPPWEWCFSVSFTPETRSSLLSRPCGPPGPDQPGLQPHPEPLIPQAWVGQSLILTNSQSAPQCHTQRTAASQEGPRGGQPHRTVRLTH